jgi:transposase InsO family protein
LAIANWPKKAPRGAVTEFCRTHGISRSWFYQLRQIVERDGPLAIAQPGSTAPRTQAHRTAVEVEDLAIAVRDDLEKEGGYGGPISVRHEMRKRGLPAPSRSTLARIFARRGVSKVEPRKRPKATRRFTYPAPNDCWQLDGFDYELLSGHIVVVLQVLDDHSRRIPASRAAPAETSVDIQAVLQASIDRVGVPQRFLSDNGAAFNPTRRGRRGMVETWLRGMGVQVIASTPGHPQTTGKSERHHQTCQLWLHAQPQARDLVELQALLDRFEDFYNHRPHQSLGMLTPMEAWAATPVTPPPTPPDPDTPDPARAQFTRIRVTRNGVVCVHGVRIRLGIEHAGDAVLVTTDGLAIQIWDRDGLHIRSVTRIPGQTYYGNGRRRGPTR